MRRQDCNALPFGAPTDAMLPHLRYVGAGLMALLLLGAIVV